MMNDIIIQLLFQTSVDYEEMEIVEELIEYERLRNGGANDD